MSRDFTVKLVWSGDDSWTVRIESLSDERDGRPFAAMRFKATSPEAAKGFAEKAASATVGHPVTLTFDEELHATFELPTETDA